MSCSARSLLRATALLLSPPLSEIVAFYATDGQWSSQAGWEALGWFRSGVERKERLRICSPAAQPKRMQPGLQQFRK